MADSKISALAAMSAWAAGDLIETVDVSDTTMGAGGTNKKSTLQQLMTVFTGSAGFNAGTVTADTPLLNHAQTWNSGGVTFSGWKLNVTNTASAAASKLLELEVGGADVFRVLRGGAVALGTDAVGCWINCPASNQFTINQAGGTGGIYSLWHFASSVGLSGVSGAFYGWASGSSADGTVDTRLYRQAAGIIGLRGNGASAGAAAELIEMTAPAAGGANTVRIYAEDNGSGKTRLMAIFPTGAAQQIAIEP